MQARSGVDGQGVQESVRGCVMSERPILFNGEMVRAILEGRKTQTRRVVKQLDLIQDTDPPAFRDAYGDWHPTVSRSPYGQPGDRLWVRETWSLHDTDNPAYKAGASEGELEYYRWHPSIHMPRKFSRITLEVTGVRVERVQEITPEDAKAEGIEHLYAPRNAFANLWNSINAKRGYSWESNPWVWVVDFTRI